MVFGILSDTHNRLLVTDGVFDLFKHHAVTMVVHRGEFYDLSRPLRSIAHIVYMKAYFLFVTMCVSME